MKDIFLSFFLFCACMLPLSAEAPDSSIIDTSLDLKVLQSLDEQQLLELFGTRVILTGIVAERIVLDAEPESWLGSIELVDGEWQGTMEIHEYRVTLLLRGDHWALRVPARRSRNPLPDEIGPGQQILVIGRIAEPLIDPVFGLQPLLEAEYIRIIN